MRRERSIDGVIDVDESIASNNIVLKQAVEAQVLWDTCALDSKSNWGALDGPPKK